MSINNEILKSIDIIVKERLRSLSFDYHIEGKIISINADGKKCLVRVDGQELSIPKRDGLTLKINDVVLICVVNGNFSHKFIDLKRPY